MKTSLPKLLLTASMALKLTACKTNESGLKITEQQARKPSTLPSHATNNAWGGQDISKWKPEAVYANSMSDFINRLWNTQSVQDVLVSIPVSFGDSGVKPYGDQQSNARITFNGAWPHKTVPLRSGLVKKTDGSAFIVFEFSPDLRLSQRKVEVFYKNHQGQSQSIVLDASVEQGNWLTATWTDLPKDLKANLQTGTAPNSAGSASGFSFFARPSPQFNDWFPVSFKHPWTTIQSIVRTVPSHLSSFKQNSGVPNPTNLTDPMNLAQSKENAPIPFDQAYDLGKRQKWPRSFIPSDRPYFPACNVHGNYKHIEHPENPSNSEFDPTSVGRNWTWVSDPTGNYPGAETVPFKILYTCFEERRLKRPQLQDPDCHGLALSSEEDTGVPSGGGWHKIGDPAETLFNSLERVPLLVSAGFERPADRGSNATPPSNGSYAFDLKDVSVARWLWPGEAFLTANSDRDRNNNEAKNFHWFLFHADRETCTLEWVHPNRPDESVDAKF
jgi:hypothetical protein